MSPGKLFAMAGQTVVEIKSFPVRGSGSANQKGSKL